MRAEKKNSVAESFEGNEKSSEGEVKSHLENQLIALEKAVKKEPESELLKKIVELLRDLAEEITNTQFNSKGNDGLW